VPEEPRKNAHRVKHMINSRSLHQEKLYTLIKVTAEFLDLLLLRRLLKIWYNSRACSLIEAQ